MKRYYPMMMDLTLKRCLVVGGGKVGARKVTSLLNAGAVVTLVSPEISASLHGLLHQINWHKRIYLPKDGEGMMLVIAATNYPEVNYQVYTDAMNRGQWINVVDQPALCNFTFPSVMTRGKLTISVSTGGASPSLAKKIKTELEEVYGEEYALYLDFMQELRTMIQQEVGDEHVRHEMFRELSSIQWMGSGYLDLAEVRASIQAWVNRCKR